MFQCTSIMTVAYQSSKNTRLEVLDQISTATTTTKSYSMGFDKTNTNSSNSTNTSSNTKSNSSSRSSSSNSNSSMFGSFFYNSSSSNSSNNSSNSSNNSGKDYRAMNLWMPQGMWKCAWLWVQISLLQIRKSLAGLWSQNDSRFNIRNEVLHFGLLSGTWMESVYELLARYHFLILLYCSNRVQYWCLE